MLVMLAYLFGMLLSLSVAVVSLSAAGRPNAAAATQALDLLPAPSRELAAAAIDILEEQSRRNVPIDAALRRRHKSNLRHSRRGRRQEQDRRREEHDHNALREFLLWVARRQYRIDWLLRGAAGGGDGDGVDDGIAITPERRVLAALGIISVERTTSGREPLVDVDRLVESHTWLRDVLAMTADENLGSGSPSQLEMEGMDLCTRLECPPWAWPGLNRAFPSEEALSMELRALLRPPPLDLRVNTLKCPRRDDALRSIVDAGFEAVPTPLSPLGIRMGKPNVALGKIPGLLSGAVEPQDEGSQLAAALLDARPGETVADYCAGSGGKTLQIAAQMENRGRLYALDVDEGRLGRGSARCAKAGVTNVQRRALQPDVERRDKWCKRRKGTFDRVLVDAPCSGVGSWRRKPDARRTWGGSVGGGGGGGSERLAELLPVQQHILRRASRLVKPGGRLVYVTCSLLPEENESQVEQFLESEEGTGWRLDPPHDFCVPFEADGGRFLRLTPAQHGTDGFFAAVLTRDPL